MSFELLTFCCKIWKSFSVNCKSVSNTCPVNIINMSLSLSLTPLSLLHHLFIHSLFWTHQNSVPYLQLFSSSLLRFFTFLPITFHIHLFIKRLIYLNLQRFQNASCNRLSTFSKFIFFIKNSIFLFCWFFISEKFSIILLK